MKIMQKMKDEGDLSSTEEEEDEEFEDEDSKESTPSTTLPSDSNEARCRYHSPLVCGYKRDQLNIQNPLVYHNVFV